MPTVTYSTGRRSAARPAPAIPRAPVRLTAVLLMAVAIVALFVFAANDAADAVAAVVGVQRESLQLWPAVLGPTLSLGLGVLGVVVAFGGAIGLFAVAAFALLYGLGGTVLL